MHQEQIERRRQRALDEGFKIRGAAKDKVFSAYQVLSPSGRTYQVSIRSLKRRINGCTCPDYQTNLLGTCKHIEAVLAFLVKRLKGRVDRIEKMAPPTTEIFLSYGERIDVMVHRPEALGGKARELLRSYFDREGVLIGDPSTKLPVLLRIWRTSQRANEPSSRSLRRSGPTCSSWSIARRTSARGNGSWTRFPRDVGHSTWLARGCTRTSKKGLYTSRSPDERF